MVNSHISIN